MTTITLSRATVEQALEALKSVQPQNMGPLIYPAITALRAALAQQAEPVEPVAWVRLEAWKSGQSWPDDCFTALPAEGLTPLYTAPPQRKPLTDEEIVRLMVGEDRVQLLYSKPGDPYFSEFAEGAIRELVESGRAIERAHGIGEEK